MYVLDRCYSYIGRIGNSPQQVSIGVGCTSLGTVTHEIGHALGFYHEQARYDRDSFVQIVTQNIQPTYLSQFSKQSYSSMVDYGVGYDYGSVMHYDQYSFTSNGGNTIATLDPNYQATIGQRLEPSFMDVKRINFAYCNSTCLTTLPCQNQGYTDPKDCSKCRCPTGLGGQLCEKADVNPASCGSGDLAATNVVQTVSVTGNVVCNYFITAPLGARVFFQITSSSFTRTTPCTQNYLEIKYVADLERVGARFCTSFPTLSLSEANKMVVIYKGAPGTYFRLNYRYDPVDFPTQPPPTTTTTTVAPTTTTTTAPTTTTATKTTTTTPRTTTKRTTRRQTTTTTTTQQTTTKTIPTTTAKAACQAWSRCTAQCGGCGTQSRRCGTYVETMYCNTNPCAGGYCCRPFFYVTQGFCLRPISGQNSNDDGKFQILSTFAKSEDSPSMMHTIEDMSDIKEKR